MKIALAVGVVVVILMLIHTVNRLKLQRLRDSGLYPPQGTGTMADVERLIMSGQKLSAVKLYREIKRVDLKDAKQAVDEMVENLPRTRG